MVYQILNLTNERQVLFLSDDDLQYLETQTSKKFPEMEPDDGHDNSAIAWNFAICWINLKNLQWKK